MLVTLRGGRLGDWRYVVLNLSVIFVVRASIF